MGVLPLVASALHVLFGRSIVYWPCFNAPMVYLRFDRISFVFCYDLRGSTIVYQGEVYGVNILMSTGEGLACSRSTKPSVLVPALNNTDFLFRLGEDSRALLAEVNERFPVFPFPLRDLKDEVKARKAALSCEVYKMLIPCTIPFEEPQDLVAHAKFTVLLLPNGTTKITGLGLPEGVYVCADKKLPPDLAKLMASPLVNRTKKKKEKKNNSLAR